MASADVAAELGPGQTVALLQALHLLTRDGHLNADARRKLKQINHLVGLLRPFVGPVLERDAGAKIIDAGTGNGYLAFALHEALLAPADRGEIVGLERRPELAEQANARARTLGLHRLRFDCMDLHDVAAQPDRLGRPRAVIALHACDTATDDAIEIALRTEAEVVAVVPCCQAEVARLLAGGSALRTPIGPLWRHPIHRRELGAHLTNVIRALVLEAHGYQVTVTELVGWEHSLKNELIVGKKVQRGNSAARRQLEALIGAFPVAGMGLLRAVERA